MEERGHMVDKAKMRDELKGILREVLDSIPPERVDRVKLHQRLQEMITYAIGRVDYYERYRTTYQTIAMGLIGGSFVVTSIFIRSLTISTHLQSCVSSCQF
jgi:hypothetical protein